MVEFWKTKTLEQMTPDEWELLCDGCAKCCLIKLEDFHSGEIFYTDVACELLDIDSCQCTDYLSRHNMIDDCIDLDIKNIQSLSWLPETCSYRLIATGRALPEWHHLETGSHKSMHNCGASLRGRAVSKRAIDDGDIEEHIIQWVD